MNYFTFICPFESGQCRKEWKKLQKLEYFDNEIAFQMKQKTFFIFFKGPSFGEKIKI